MSRFVRDLIDQTVRELGVVLPEDRLYQVEQSVMRELADTYAGETLRLYVPRVTASDRILSAKRRQDQIRAAWDGRNADAIAARFGVSRATVYRIVGKVSPSA